MRRSWCAVRQDSFFDFPAPSDAAENESGKALLEKNCGLAMHWLRGHRVRSAGTEPLECLAFLFDRAAAVRTIRRDWLKTQKHAADPVSIEEIEKIEKSHLVSEAIPCECASLSM